jgi:16S rRNA (guanine966-N2)-methyltransferase
MRIIAGTLKGRRLQGPPAQGVRPTSDRLRETIFNILRDDVEGGRVLDAFAGTGAMGLEAWSRGAATVTFVERDRAALAVLRANVAACGAAEACAIIAADFIGLAARQGGLRGFTLALLDPPYDFADLDAALVEAGRLLAPGGLIVLEYSRRRTAPEPPPGFVRRRVVAAGDSALALYARPDADTTEERAHV